MIFLFSISQQLREARGADDGDERSDPVKTNASAYLLVAVVPSSQRINAARVSACFTPAEDEQPQQPRSAGCKIICSLKSPALSFLLSSTWWQPQSVEFDLIS